MNYIVSKNNTIHIPLNNNKNVICYMIVTLQKLHCSPTLNTLLQIINMNSLDNLSRILLEPLIIYSKINIDNLDETYKQLSDYLNNMYNNYVSENMVNGYTQNIMLLGYYLPLINHHFKYSFQNIINEIFLLPTEFSSSNQDIREHLIGEDTRFFKSLELGEQMLKYYDKMFDDRSKIIKSDENYEMVCEPLEIYTLDNNKGGHVVVLMKTNENKLYVIDDQIHLTEFIDYYKLYIDKLIKLVLINIDPKTHGELNHLLSPYKSSFDIRLRRFVLDNSDKFEKIHVDDEFNSFTYKKLKDKYRITGGNTNNLLLSILFWTTFILIVLLLIIVLLFRFPPPGFIELIGPLLIKCIRT